MKHKIKVEVVSDVVCPWCYIGKRRLEKAVQQLSNGFDFEIVYHPFELHPDLPMMGVIQKDYLIKKFGGVDRYRQVTHHAVKVAAQEGLSLDFDKQKILPNTRKPQSLIQYAKNENRQRETVEAFFQAYFLEGVDLSADVNILNVAVKAGLTKNIAENILNDEKVLLKTALKEKEIYNLGITGVPFYIINNKYGISGAQPVGNFIQAFERVSKEYEGIRV